jgi:hypothetical protein
MGASGSYCITVEREDLLSEVEAFDRSVKKTEFLLSKIGAPSLSEKIFCKNSELKPGKHSDDKECHTMFKDKEELLLYARQCIEFYHSLLENRQFKVMSNSNFDAFINGGRLWYLLNTHYSRCMFPPDEKALTIIKEVLGVWHLTLITVSRSYLPVAAHHVPEMTKETKDSPPSTNDHPKPGEKDTKQHDVNKK